MTTESTQVDLEEVALEPVEAILEEDEDDEGLVFGQGLSAESREYKRDFKGPTPPRKMPKDAQLEAEEIAKNIVRELQAADGKDELDLADRIGSSGGGVRRTAADNLRDGNVKLSRLVQYDHEEGGRAGLKESMSKLEAKMRTVHPKYVEREPFIRLMKMVPFMGDWMVKTLETIAQRNRTVEDFVRELKESLETHKHRLRVTYANMKIVLEGLEVDRKSIEEEAYFAELLWQQVEEAISQTEDPEKRSMLEDVLDEVVGQAQDLRAMNEAYAQFQQTIRIHRKTIRLTVKAIDRMIDLGLNLVAISFLIYSSLIEQRDGLELVQESRSFIGEQLRANSVLLKDNIRMLGDIMKNPMVAMKALEESHNNIVSAIEEYDRTRAEARTIARANVEKMKEMTEKLDTRAGFRAAEKEEVFGLGEILSSRPTTSPERPRIGDQG